MNSADVNRRIFDIARRDRSHLFDGELFRRRVVEEGFDAVVALTGVNVSYTGGVFTKGEEFPEAMLTTADGAQVLIAAEDYAMNFAETSWVADIRPFRHGPDVQEQCMALLGEALAELGLSGARIGLEGPVKPEVLDPLQARLPAASFGDALHVFEGARRIKTAGEIELYRAAMVTTQNGLRAGWAASRPGDTEKMVAARIQSAGLELGADWTSHCQMQSGAHSTVAMAPSLETPLEPGEVVHVDYGGIFGGYRTDFARNAVVGAASKKQASIYARLADIQHNLIDRIVPGMSGGEIWDIALEQYSRVGELTHPWSTFGHGIGLELHEGINLAKGATDKLEPGMLINVEPSHFEQGDARYHIEDTLLITDVGNEVLANAEVTGDSWVSPVMQAIV